MQKIEEVVMQLGKIRKGVPQFLYVENIFPNGTIKLRAEILNFKKANPKSEELDFIINSPGGLADDAYRIIRTLRNNFKTVNVIVPFWAKSAATLLSLGASVIVMDEFGEFGPLDAQIGRERDDRPEFERESALNDEHSVSRIVTMFKEMFESMYVRIYEHKKINIPRIELSKQLLENLAHFYEPLLKQINTPKLGQKRRILDIGAEYARRILLQFNNVKPQESRRLVDYLVNTCPDHGYIIDYAMIKEFLTFVKKPEEFFSKEYKEMLEVLSLLLIVDDTTYHDADNKEFRYIGFVTEKVVIKNNKVSVKKIKKQTSNATLNGKQKVSNNNTNGRKRFEHKEQLN